MATIGTTLNPDLKNKLLAAAVKSETTKIKGIVSSLSNSKGYVRAEGITYAFVSYDFNGRMSQLRQGDEVWFIPEINTKGENKALKVSLSPDDLNGIAKIHTSDTTQPRYPEVKNNTISDEVKVGSIISLKNGFGFIKYPPNNLFFHHSTTRCDFNKLKVNTPIKFNMAKNIDGDDIAINVDFAWDVEGKTLDLSKDGIINAIAGVNINTSAEFVFGDGQNPIVPPVNTVKSFFMEENEEWGKVFASDGKGIWVHHIGFRKNESKEEVNRLIYHGYDKSIKKNEILIDFIPISLISITAHILGCVTIKGEVKIINSETKEVFTINKPNSEIGKEFVCIKSFEFSSRNFLVLGLNIKQTPGKSGEVWIYEVLNKDNKISLFPLHNLHEVPGNARSKEEVSSSGYEFGKEIQIHNLNLLIGSSKEKTTSVSKEIGAAYLISISTLMKTNSKNKLQKIDYKEFKLGLTPTNLVTLDAENYLISVQEDTENKGLWHMIATKV